MVYECYDYCTLNIPITLTQCSVGGGTPTSVAGSDRDCVAHALLEAADVQGQGGRVSRKDP